MAGGARSAAELVEFIVAAVESSHGTADGLVVGIIEINPKIDMFWEQRWS